MDSLNPEKPEESTAIVTVQQYCRELRKAPAQPRLSKENQARAAELARQLVRGEDQLDDMVTFGSDAQATVARISKDILGSVRLGALQDVIQLSDSVLAEVHSLDLGDLLPEARPVLRLFHETKAAIERRIRNFFAKYELINTHLDRQEADIFAKEAVASERFRRDKALAKATLDTMLDAQIKATAIKIFLDSDDGHAETQRRLQAVGCEKEAAQAEHRSVDMLVLAAADRHGKYLERLEEKGFSLTRLIYSAYQMNVTIRMMGNNENIIRQKLSDIRTDLLPQWRVLIAIAYQACQQQGIAQIVERLSIEETNLRRQAGDQMEEAAKRMAALMKSSGIDIDAMRYYSERLTKSLDILKTASFEAGKIRDTAETEIQKLISDMDHAVAATALRRN